jgi:hypothetical protein
MDEEEARTLMNAILESDLMNKTSDYLSAGRQFEGISLEDLSERWTRAIRKWFSADCLSLEELDHLSR